MENWHLNKSVPVTLLLLVGTTFFSATQSITAVELRTLENERDIMKSDAKVAALEVNVQGQQVSLARIDENIRYIKETLDVLSKQQE
jgi:hypothetical protein